ncbi:integration host factor subunit beta [Methylobacterium sp. J-048]|uniref:HU family DNA-binding protein n=1 Tax=unclassified Methylobacterium TaxID=2615210 RepID=UPI001FB9A62E|nr:MULTISPECIES: HU family DNA-binding protein [unclassified Methylobacterium]MCJ2060203.1 integration host factor subunit beta [Methylobacterium sp. J-048]MCJ2094942.1 integration host factor subunit beta [Methylobacterium sp. J-072]
MIRSELVARIAEQNPHLFARDVEAVVATILDTMADALAQGGRVELRGFGVFEHKRREARIRRNPRSQDAVKVPESVVVGFKPGQAMRDLLNPPVQGRAREAERRQQAS